MVIDKYLITIISLVFLPSDLHW